MRKFIAAGIGIAFLLCGIYFPTGAQISSIPAAKGGGVVQAYQTIMDEAIALFQRTTVNFTGSGITCVDNPGSSRTDCTVGGGTTSSANITDLAVTKDSSTVLDVATGIWGHGTASMATHAGTKINITSLSISAATNASPIVLTTSDMSATSVRTGDTVTVAGVGGNTAANGTWVVEKASNTSLKLIGSVGSGSYTSGGTVAGTGSGTAYIYGTPQGYVTIDSPVAAALILTCPTVCVMNQSTTPAVPDNGTPFASVTISSGAWGTVTDTRRFLNSGASVTGGDGITISTAAGESAISVDSTVARTSGSNSFTGSNSFLAATSTAPNRSGSGAPGGSCSTGETYFRTSGVTAGQNLYLCTALNTWTQVTGTGGSTQIVTYRLPFTASTADTSGRFAMLWNTSLNVTAAGRDATGGTCPTTSSLAECGLIWYSTGVATQSYATHDVMMPTGWSSGTATFFLTFGVTSTDDPQWQVKTKCLTSGSAPGAFNSTQNLPTGAVVAGNIYTRSISLTTTGCAANRPMIISLTRTDSGGGYAIVFDGFVEIQVQ